MWLCWWKFSKFLQNCLGCFASVKIAFFEMQVAMRRVEHKPFAGFQLKTIYVHLPQNLVSNFQFFWKGTKQMNFWKKRFLLKNDEELKLKMLHKDNIKNRRLAFSFFFASIVFFQIELSAKSLFLLKAKFGNKKIERFVKTVHKLDAFPFFFSKKVTVQRFCEKTWENFHFFSNNLHDWKHFDEKKIFFRKKLVVTILNCNSISIKTPEGRFWIIQFKKR